MISKYIVILTLSYGLLGSGTSAKNEPLYNAYTLLYQRGEVSGD
jgi:hypothetical protein